MKIINNKFILNFIILMILSFSIGYFFKKSNWDIITYIILVSLVIFSLLITNFDKKYLLFNSICLIPCINYFIPFGLINLTLPELFFAIYLTKFLISNKVKINNVTFFYISFLLCCLISIIGSPIGLSIMGLFLRFSIVFISSLTLINNSFDKESRNFILHSFYTIPLITIAAYQGEDLLSSLFSDNLFSFQRVIYSFQYPIWFALFAPLFIYIKTNKSIIFLYFLLLFIFILLSFSRSIYIGTGVAIIFFVFYYKNYNNKFHLLKSIFITIFTISFYILLIVFKDDTRLSFTSLESGSNEARFRKFNIAYNYIYKHPFFGNGFGIQYIFDIAEEKSTRAKMNDLLSPEFGPLTLLTEVGIFGSLFYYLILAFFYRKSILVLKNLLIPNEQKLLVLIAIMGITSTFLNSNSYPSIIILTFIPLPSLILDIRKKYKNSNI
jgi:hypothetical protein